MEKEIQHAIRTIIMLSEMIKAREAHDMETLAWVRKAVYELEKINTRQRDAHSPL